MAIYNLTYTAAAVNSGSYITLNNGEWVSSQISRDFTCVNDDISIINPVTSITIPSGVYIKDFILYDIDNDISVLDYDAEHHSFKDSNNNTITPSSGSLNTATTNVNGGPSLYGFSHTLYGDKWPVVNYMYIEEMLSKEEFENELQTIASDFGQGFLYINYMNQNLLTYAAGEMGKGDYYAFPVTYLQPIYNTTGIYKNKRVYYNYNTIIIDYKPGDIVYYNNAYQIVNYGLEPTIIGVPNLNAPIQYRESNWFDKKDFNTLSIKESNGNIIPATSYAVTIIGSEAQLFTDMTNAKAYAKANNVSYNEIVIHFNNNSLGQFCIIADNDNIKKLGGEESGEIVDAKGYKLVVNGYDFAAGASNIIIRGNSIVSIDN